jgi:alkyl hydroperoxide reductase subunit AhpF
MSLLKIYQGQAIQAALSAIVSPVQVDYAALDQPEPDTLSALADLTALTPFLSVTTHPADPHAPADRVIVRSRAGRDLVFVGAPLGLELATLVSAIIVAGRGDSGLAQATKETLAGLSIPVHLQVFTTPT